MNGLVAANIRLSHEAQPVLATGAWLSNTLCVTHGRQAWVSAVVGDLATPEACLAHEATARALLQALETRPAAIAHDLHPDFHSSRHAAYLAAQLDVPLIAVQHHHAHIAALAAEHGVEQPLLGLALDGVGLGTDDIPWGGELLLVDGAKFSRLGCFRPLPLPGGDRAAQEPWRLAAAVLHEAGRGMEITTRFHAQPGAATVAAMLARDLNCPRTSSAGRVFDAAAGLLGICTVMAFESQAARLLEQAAASFMRNNGRPLALEDGWHIDRNGRLDLLPLLTTLAGTEDTGYGAALFHTTLAAALAEWVVDAARHSGVTVVACGGGCFFNEILSSELQRLLSAENVRLLTAKSMQPGDSAISLGQAWVAIHRLESL
ncbi:MAG TPA: carbamoyltransferase HypF [Methylophilaceae bacterium]|nr:carbamoyltransferase HypF [Methylophilaceae bacterium]